jgi:hypothetical protein
MSPSRTQPPGVAVSVSSASDCEQWDIEQGRTYLHPGLDGGYLDTRQTRITMFCSGETFGLGTEQGRQRWIPKAPISMLLSLELVVLIQAHIIYNVNVSPCQWDFLSRMTRTVVSKALPVEGSSILISSQAHAMRAMRAYWCDF